MKKLLIFSGLLTMGFINAQYEGKVGVNTETPSATLNVKSKTGTTSATKNFELENASGTKMLTVLDNGYVGVNTTEPAERFHIRNTSMRIEGTSSIGGFLTLANTSKPLATEGSMPMWRIYNMSGTYGNTLQFWGYPNLTGSSAGAMQSVLVLSDTGKIGMSVSAPTEKLDVNGNARLRTLPNVAGSDTDKVVVADAGGVLKTVERSNFASATQGGATLDAITGVIRTVNAITIASWAEKVDGKPIFAQVQTSSEAIQLPAPNDYKYRIISVNNQAGTSLNYAGTNSPANSSTLTAGKGHLLMSDGNRWFIIGGSY